MRPGVGVGVIVKKDGKVLMQKRMGAHGEGTWSFPGGHLEFGESPEQTAVRETKEEVNVDIKNAKIVGLTNDVHHSENKHYITIFVEAEYAGGDIKPLEGEVVEAGVEFGVEQLTDNPVSSIKRIATLINILSRSILSPPKTFPLVHAFCMNVRSVWVPNSIFSPPTILCLIAIPLLRICLLI